MLQDLATLGVATDQRAWPQAQDRRDPHRPTAGVGRLESQAGSGFGGVAPLNRDRKSAPKDETGQPRNPCQARIAAISEGLKIV